jgi:hypothetical protein
MTTCLTSPPKIRKTAFMRARIADMKAPPSPRPECADTVAVVQDDPFDLATSTFRPTAQSVLADLKETQGVLAELQAPIVEKLRRTLRDLNEVKSLGSAAENADAAATVYRLAKKCEMDLTYQGKPVALSFKDGQGYKVGAFCLRTLGEKQRQVYEKTDFPPLELAPATALRRR